MFGRQLEVTLSRVCTFAAENDGFLSVCDVFERTNKDELLGPLHEETNAATGRLQLGSSENKVCWICWSEPR